MRKSVVTLLTVVMLGVTAAAVAAKPEPRVRDSDPALFHDATGKVVGPCLSESMVLLRLEAHTVPVSLGNSSEPYVSSIDFSKAYWSFDGYLLFEDSYCGGQAYLYRWDGEKPLPLSFPGSRAAGVVIKDSVTGRHILHVGSTSDALSTPLTVFSMKRATGQCTTKMMIADFTGTIPVTETYDLDSLFTLPLKLR